MCAAAWLFSSTGYASAIMESLLIIQLLLSIVSAAFFLVDANGEDGVYRFFVILGVAACSIAMSTLYYKANDIWGTLVPLATLALLRVSILLVCKYVSPP